MDEGFVHRFTAALGGGLGLVVGAMAGFHGRLTDDDLQFTFLVVLGVLLAAIAGAMFAHDLSGARARIVARGRMYILLVLRAVAGFLLGALELAIVLGVFMGIAFALNALSEIPAFADLYQRWPVTVEFYVEKLLELVGPFLLGPVIVGLVTLAVILVPEGLLRISGGAALGGAISVIIGLPFSLLLLLVHGGGPHSTGGAILGGLLGTACGIPLGFVTAFIAYVLHPD
ncbi:MAG TPA: hypothetical protein VHJ83_05025 [Micromonosporaceae bacterium]|nr:hypothetical protein [Micromonosporaceae bacterium]